MVDVHGYVSLPECISIHPGKFSHGWEVDPTIAQEETFVHFQGDWDNDVLTQPMIVNFFCFWGLHGLETKKRFMVRNG